MNRLGLPNYNPVRFRGTPERNAALRALVIVRLLCAAGRAISDVDHVVFRHVRARAA